MSFDNRVEFTSKQQKAKHYSKIKRKLFLVQLILSFNLLFIVLFSGLSSWFVLFLKTWIPTDGLLLIAVYVGGALMISDVIFMPLSFYSEYLLEHRFELSNLTVATWFKDHLKELALSLLFGIFMIEILYLFLRQFSHTWWLWAFGAWLVFSWVVGKLAPVILLPIFYKIKPLENPLLVQKLEHLASQVKAKVLGVFEMDMSRKTKKANAMFTGIGSTKRIILGDTLLEKFSEDEIEVILAHEMGHYYYKHILFQLLIGSILFLSGLYCVDLLLDQLVPYFGFNGIDDIAGLPLFSLILSVFFLFTMPISNGFSRACERSADRFALKLTQNKVAFIASMEKLADQNLADTDPPRWVEWLLHSHPSIHRRIQMAQNFNSNGSFKNYNK